MRYSNIRIKKEKADTFNDSFKKINLENTSIENLTKKISYEELWRCHQELSDYILEINNKKNSITDFEFVKNQNILITKTNQDLRILVKKLLENQKDKNNYDSTEVELKNQNNVYNNHYKLMSRITEESNELKESIDFELISIENKKLISKNKSLVEKIDLIEKQYEQKIKDLKINEKENQINELSNQISTLESQLSQLDKEIQKKNEFNCMLKKVVESKTEELKNYEEKVIILQTKNAKVKSKYIFFKSEAMNEKLNTEKFINEINQMNINLDESHLVIKKLEDKVHNLSDQIKKELDINRSLTENLNEVNENLTKMKLIETDLQNQKLVEIANIEKLQKKIDNQNSQISLNDLEIKNLNFKIVEIKKDKENLDDIIYQIDKIVSDEYLKNTNLSLFDKIKEKMVNLINQNILLKDKNDNLTQSISQFNQKHKDTSNKIFKINEFDNYFKFLKRNFSIENNLELSDIKNKVLENNNLNLQIEKLEIINLNYQKEIIQLKKNLEQIYFNKKSTKKCKLLENHEVVQFKNLIEYKISIKNDHIIEINKSIEKIKNENSNINGRIKNLINKNEMDVSNIKSLTKIINNLHEEVLVSKKIK